MTLTKNNFCIEAKKLLPDGYILFPKSKNYTVFLHFLINELQELPFEDELGETELLRDDAKEIVNKLVEYLSIQSKRIKKGAEWDLDQSIISQIYNIEFYEVFKNIINPDTGLEGICYSLDLAIDGNNRPIGFSLDRYFVKSRKKNVIVHRRGCIDLFYDGQMKIFTYQDKWP